MNLYRFAWTTLALLLAPLAVAKLRAPDHVIYGSATVFGAPAGNGSLIELRTFPEGELLSSYVIGRDAALGNQFALRIPMDTVEPRAEGHGRPGDLVRIYLAGQHAASTTVGEVGVAVRLDLDPQNMGTGPAINITAAEVLEGNAGTTPLQFTVSLSTTSASPVSMNWATSPGTATGAANCSGAADFLNEQGSLSIPAGQLQGTITVSVCGDGAIENSESLSVALSTPGGGILQDFVATGTIVDDDDLPRLEIPLARVIEPQSGTRNLVFLARLSRAPATAASVAFSTVNGSALAGADYQSSSGSIQFAAGVREATVSVPVNSDGSVEALEYFELELSAPVALQVLANRVRGDIVDSAFEPEPYPLEDGTSPNNAVPGPSDLVLTSDGAFGYAISQSTDTVYAFSRDTSSGRLILIASYTALSPNFTGALLDGPTDAELSPANDSLYVASRNSGAVVTLARDANTGLLTYVQSVSGVDLQGASAVHVSADGASVYATGGTANSLMALGRNASTGELTQIEVERNDVDDLTDAGNKVVGMDRPTGITSSADGAQVYVASRFGNSVLTFSRETTAGANFGKLNFVAAAREGIAGISGIAGAYDLVLSPDGAQLYVAAEASNAVTIFDRAADGSLSLRRSYRKGDTGIHGLAGAQSIALSPDGAEVYVAGFLDDSFSVFRRAQAASPGVLAGDLSIKRTFIDGEGEADQLKGAVAVSASTDGRFIYVAATTDNAISLFARTLDSLILLKDGFEDSTP